jgi:cell division protein FtsI (penicillin-binding protein 3)
VIAKAKAGSVVVIDAITGEVLALASFTATCRQTPEPDRRAAAPRGHRHLRAPARPLKPITAAIALEAGASSRKP